MSGTELEFDVTAADTARALGSGDVDVLATPRLIAWCEAATVAATASGPDALPADRTSVGTRVRIDHLAATPVGGRVTVSAGLAHRDGRLLRFEVAASDRSGRVVASGEIFRVVVERAGFAARVPPP